jgi:hypothetical protein
MTSLHLSVTVDSDLLTRVDEAAKEWMDSTRENINWIYSVKKEVLLDEMTEILRDIFGDIPLTEVEIMNKAMCWYKMVRKTFELPSTFLKDYHLKRILFH